MIGQRGPVDPRQPAAAAAYAPWAARTATPTATTAYRPPYGDRGPTDDGYDDDRFEARDDDDPGAKRRGTDTVRHAYYPGRRMNLGVVLLPLRIFLGFISVYAGMGKLCDPVYFDGGERGSMVKWLQSLHPWALAEPLRDFALSHPVGAGLTVAFLQVVVGVLTICGLWQRVAAVDRRAAVRRAAGHRQLAHRPRLRRARHHLPRRLEPADHRGRPRLLHRRPARRRGLAAARPARRVWPTCGAGCCAAAP